MLFYLYLITTAFHFQNGWSLVGISSDYKLALHQVAQTHHYSDPWKFVHVYQFPANVTRHAVVSIVDWTSVSYFNEQHLDWYVIDIEKMTYLFRKMNVTYSEIDYRQVHDEL